MCLTMASPRPVPPVSRERDFVDAIKAFGQARHMLGRDAGPVVADTEQGAGFRAPE